MTPTTSSTIPGSVLLRCCAAILTAQLAELDQRHAYRMRLGGIPSSRTQARLRQQRDCLHRIRKDHTSPDSPELEPVPAELAGLLCALASGHTFGRVTVERGRLEGAQGTAARVRDVLLGEEQ